MHKKIIGIDFGTTNSCISYYSVENKKVIVIENNDGEYTSPSFLFFDPDSDNILFGKAAKNLFNLNTDYRPNIFNNLKRLIGKTYNELINDNSLYQFFKHNNLHVNTNDVNTNNTIQFTIKYNKKNVIFSVEDLITIYLRYLIEIIHEKCNEKIDSHDIVITIPSYFNDIQRNILKNICNSLNLNVVRIINEPTSAALAYAHTHSQDIKKKESEYVLVFDCGGGTTDLTLLYMDYEENIYQVKNVIGDNFLGGEDITMYLINYIKNKLTNKHNLKITEKIEKNIGILCEIAKKELSFKENTNIIIDVEEVTIQIPLSRVLFLDLCKAFFKKIENLIKFISIKECKNVIFVGGTTRIPYMEYLFKDFKINKSLDPDQTISIGASIDGALLCNLLENDFKEAFLLDVIPLTLGIEIEGGLMSPIISRNSFLPTTKTKEFTNSKSFEEKIVINIYQGERRFVKDNIFLVSFTLKDTLCKLKNALKNTIIIKVTFNVNNDGIISASARFNDTDTDTDTCSDDCSVIVTKTYNTNTDTENKNTTDLLLESELYKLLDSELANKTILKLELFDSFKYLLSIFKQRCENNIYDDFKKLLFNKLFNNTFDIIINYKNESVKTLKDTKVSFEKEWHLLSSNLHSIELGGGTDIT